MRVPTERAWSHKSMSYYRPLAKTVLRQALRYGTFWPGALAVDAYGMYKRKYSRRSITRPAKRSRMSYTRAYRPMMRRRLRRSKPVGKFARWNKTKRAIPSTHPLPYKTYRYAITNTPATAKPGAAMETHCLTDLPISARELNVVKIKSFDIDLHFMPHTGATRPTWVRFAIVVQTGDYSLPVATNLLSGLTHSDSYINMSSDRDGWMNRTLSLNPLYRVIYAKTLKMAPLLEAGATSVQSNLNAQCNIRQRVKYDKILTYDTNADNVAVANNVFVMFWFDDDYREALTASATTHRFVGHIRTNYRIHNI